MIRISLFASSAVIVDVEEKAIVLTGRSASLMAYLSLGHGRYFSRSELLERLWQDRRGHAAPGSLSTALWRLRRIVERPPLKPGDLIVSDRRGAIGLNAPPSTSLDVDEFERLIAPGLRKSSDQLSSADISDLEKAVALYTSDILLDLSEDWAVQEREKYRLDYLDALKRLIKASINRHDYEKGIRYARALLGRDSLREDVHRELMRLFVLNGQRAQALRQFEQCREMLRRELAIQPMPETMELYQSIATASIGVRHKPELS